MYTYSPNQRLYESVIHAMSDHDDNSVSSEQVDDPRQLSDVLIRNFPWPIGVEVRRLFSGTLLEPNRARLDQIFRTVERCMQFLSFIMICDLYKQQKRAKTTILGPPVANEFRNRISSLTLGNYIWIVKTIGKRFQENGNKFELAEINEFCNPKSFDLIDFWSSERNDIGHFKMNLPGLEIEKRCVRYEEKLIQTLRSLSFLSNYKLVSINKIKVLKWRGSKAQHEYTLDILNHSSSDFQTLKVIHTTSTESNAVVLMSDLETPAENLNLSPFIIDTNDEIIDSKEKFSLKKDIFLFTRFYRNKLYYSGTEATNKCDLSSLSYYPQLLKEFKEILSVITQHSE